MKNMLTTITKSSIRLYTWATTWRPTHQLRHNMSATEAAQHPIPTNTHPHTSLSLAALLKTQEITQPPANLTTRDTVIHSIQHFEPTLQHTSKFSLITPVPPPGGQHCYLQYQDLWLSCITPPHPLIFHRRKRMATNGTTPVHTVPSFLKT